MCYGAFLILACRLLLQYVITQWQLLLWPSGKHAKLALLLMAVAWNGKWRSQSGALQSGERQVSMKAP